MGISHGGYFRGTKGSRCDATPSHPTSEDSTPEKKRPLIAVSGASDAGPADASRYGEPGP